MAPENGWVVFAQGARCLLGSAMHSRELGQDQVRRLWVMLEKQASKLQLRRLGSGLVVAKGALVMDKGGLVVAKGGLVAAW